MKNSLPSILTTACLTLLTGSTTWAATPVWNGTGSTWNVTTNWTPNVTGGPASGDTATFDGTGVANLNVALSGAGTATTIAFTGTPGAYVIGTSGGSAISLASGGGITMASTVTNTETVNAPLTFLGSNTFTNNSTSGTAALNIGAAAATSAATLTLNGSSTAANTVSGILANSGAVLSLTKNGTGNWTLTGANTYTGNTSISTGSLIVAGAAGQIFGGGTITIGNGGTLVVDDRGAGNANANRLGNSNAITLGNGATFKYIGSDQTSTNSSETTGVVTLSGGLATITVSNTGTNSAKVTAGATAGGLSRTANTGGIALINGTGLGSSASGAQFLTATAPTVTGTTAGSTAINSSVKNMQVASFVLGESGTGTGQTGTATGTANTFLTYNSSTGFRPLNPTDEFTNNAITAGNNTYITAATSAGTTASINSLVINGGNLSIANGVTLTDSSAQLLFVTSNAINGTGTGTLGFGANEGIVSVDAGQTGTIGAVVTGTGGLTVYGPGALTLSGANTYSGQTTVATNGTLSIGNNAALGTSTVISGGTIKSDTQARTINNTYVVNGGSTIGGSNDLTFSGNGSNPAVTVNNNVSRNFVVTNTGTTTISGTLSLLNAASGTSYQQFLQTGNSANLVITGPIQDNNSGNTATGGVLNLNFAGVGANITIAPTTANNAFGATKVVSVVSNSYNTLTLGGPTGSAHITPFGAASLALNGTSNFFLQADRNGLILDNNITASGSSGSSFGFTGANDLTLGGTYTTGSGTASAATITNLATGTLTFGNTVTIGSQFIFSIVGSGNTTFNSSSTINSAQAFTKAGTGTLTLSGVNNGTGITSLNGGINILDYSAGNANRLSTNTTTTALTLGGATVQLKGGSYAQALGTGGGTTLNAGQSSIVQTGGGTSTLALGAIARATNNGGVIDFGTGVASTTSTNSSGILGGWATVNGTDWAVGGGTIAALGSYDSFATVGTNKNILQANSGSVAASVTVNTLKITDNTTSQSLAIGSSQTLTLSGNGLLFTGANDYSITGGTLRSNTGTTNDLVVQQYGSGVLTIGSVIANGTGTSGLTKAGSGTLVLTNAANTYSGTTFIDQGILSVSADGNLGVGGSVTLNGGTLETTAGFTSTRGVTLGTNGATFQVDTGTLTLSGAVGSGTYGSLTKTGNGTLLLQGSNNYNGATTVTAGTLKLGNANALGVDAKTNYRATSPVFVNGGTLDIAGFTVGLGNLTLAGGTISDSVGGGSLSAYTYTLQSGTVGAVMTDTGNGAAVNANLVNTSTATAVNKTTVGTVILSGNNTYTGATIISAGTLQIGANGTSGTLGTGNVTDNATLAFARTDATSVGNAISGSGAVSQTGSGTTTLAGANSYSGGTTVSNGILQVGSTSALGSTSGTLAVNGGGTLDLNQINQTVGSTSLGTTGTSTGSTLTSSGGAATLTTGGVAVRGTGNVIGSNVTVSGAVTQAASSGLTVNGTAGNASLGSGASLAGTGTVGTVGLSGSNVLSSTGTLHTSGITVAGLGNSLSSGTVTGNIGFSGTSALSVNGTATGSVIVSSGATLGGSGSVGALTVQSGGVVSPGNSPGTLTASSATFLSGGSYTLQMNSAGTGAAGTNWDKLALTGSLNIASLTSASPFTLTLQTLTGTNVAGALASFDPTTSHTWASVVTTGGVISSFNTNLFAIDTSGFQNSFTGTFSVAMNGNNLDLVYTAVVPEPSTWAMLFGGLGLLLLVQRKRAKSIS